MRKKIVFKTRTGFTLYGDVYDDNKNSPMLFDYAPRRTQQDFEELDKALDKHQVDFNDVERWWIEEE